jgi:hypothetical protein
MKRRPKLEHKKTMLLYGQVVQITVPIFITDSVEKMEVYCDYLEEEILKLRELSKKNKKIELDCKALYQALVDIDEEYEEVAGERHLDTVAILSNMQFDYK